MTISELSYKAAFIADRRRQLHKQWHTYCNTLIQAVTTTKQTLHLEIQSSPDEGLNFSLFNQFTLQVTRNTDFNDREIHYILSTRDGQHRIPLASSHLDIDGLLDGQIRNTDRQAVLEHYLARISCIYDHLYQAMQQDIPLTVEALTPALLRPSQS
jgi:formate hydrogenlyase regulatory protein HycA